eukprot:TRINITY_DN428_c0_g1_i3.p1 TRINITY_DN428_c0_g1~~TRINITY_DN428_c0_g1_i3.p1  ORF type:complete len:182 (-),score=46.65 TRINITY_DN428_c0_g1_i3:68-571(-)
MPLQFGVGVMMLLVPEDTFATALGAVTIVMALATCILFSRGDATGLTVVKIMEFILGLAAVVLGIYLLETQKLCIENNFRRQATQSIDCSLWEVVGTASCFLGLVCLIAAILAHRASSSSVGGGSSCSTPSMPKKSGGSKPKKNNKSGGSKFGGKFGGNKNNNSRVS